MITPRSLFLGAGTALALVLFPAAAVAAETQADASVRPAVVDTAPKASSDASRIEAPASVLAELAPIPDADLVEERGGQQVTLTNQTLVALTSGNVLNGDYVAGAVTLSDNALSGFNGVGNLLINTGAQVSLQTGMNLTIIVEQ